MPAQFADYRQTLNMQEATLTTNYRYVDHQRSTQIQVTTFVSQASTHLAATQISLTPDFDGTVELSFALNLWAPHQPRLPLAKLTGEQMQEAVAANNMQLVAIAPATPDRAALWYHGDTHVLAANGDLKNLTLALDGRAEQGLSMAEAAAVALPDGVVPSDIALYKSQYRLALNVKIKVQKNRQLYIHEIRRRLARGVGRRFASGRRVGNRRAKGRVRCASRSASGSLARTMAL